MSHTYFLRYNGFQNLHYSPPCVLVTRRNTQQFVPAIQKHALATPPRTNSCRHTHRHSRMYAARTYACTPLHVPAPSIHPLHSSPLQHLIRTHYNFSSYLQQCMRDASVCVAEDTQSTFRSYWLIGIPDMSSWIHGYT